MTSPSIFFGENMVTFHMSDYTIIILGVGFHVCLSFN